VDGNIQVPSESTFYLAGGTYVNARFHIGNASKSKVLGHGFIWEGPSGALLIERSKNIAIKRVTSLGVHEL